MCVALMTRRKLADSEEPDHGHVMSTKQAGVRRALQEVRSDWAFWMAGALKCGGWKQNKAEKGRLFFNVYFEWAFVDCSEYRQDSGKRNDLCVCVCVCTCVYV